MKVKGDQPNVVASKDVQHASVEKRNWRAIKQNTTNDKDNSTRSERNT